MSDATVSLQAFRNAFSQQWCDDLHDRDKELRRAYRENKGQKEGPLTTYMLGKNQDGCRHSFFARVARKLGQEPPLRERQYLDMI